MSSKTGKEASLKDIADDINNYDVVFFGEEHNDSVAHFLQMELLKGMFEAYGDKVTLSMEMFETDCQLVLDEYLAGLIREKNIKKEARTWSNYKDYRPMVEFAKEKKLRVVAANSPARYNNMASRNGQSALKDLSKTAKSYLPPLPYDTATGPYYEKFMNQMSDGASAGIPSKDTSAKAAPSMSSMMPKHIVHSQSLWDATMAYSISKIFKGDKKAKVLQLNGKFHSDEGYGIVTQLKKYNPKLKVLIISSNTGDKEFPNVTLSSENRKLGDFIIFTDPNIPRTYKE